MEINIFDGIDFDVVKNIPIGYENGEILYEEYNGAFINLNDIFNRDNSLDFVESLPDWLCIQIGDTFYQKNPNEFLYDYFGSSSKYKNNLEELVYEDVFIFIKHN